MVRLLGFLVFFRKVKYKILKCLLLSYTCFLLFLKDCSLGTVRFETDIFLMFSFWLFYLEIYIIFQLKGMNFPDLLRFITKKVKPFIAYLHSNFLSNLGGKADSGSTFRFICGKNFYTLTNYLFISCRCFLQKKTKQLLR